MLESFARESQNSSIALTLEWRTFPRPSVLGIWRAAPALLEPTLGRTFGPVGPGVVRGRSARRLSDQRLRVPGYQSLIVPRAGRPGSLSFSLAYHADDSELSRRAGTTRIRRWVIDEAGG